MKITISLRSSTATSMKSFGKTGSKITMNPIPKKNMTQKTKTLKKLPVLVGKTNEVKLNKKIKSKEELAQWWEGK